MIKRIFTLLTRYREIILYCVFGGLTTLVNIAAYIGFMRIFTGKTANVSAVCVAWILSVLFAYFTNRKWVFNSKATGFASIMKECGSFFAARVFSGLIDLGIMYAAVDIMGYNGEITKLLSNILVIIINYILSKFIIFK